MLPYDKLIKTQKNKGLNYYSKTFYNVNVWRLSYFHVDIQQTQLKPNRQIDH